MISAGIRLTGDLAGNGDVLILGRFDGHLHVGGQVVVGPGGVAKADVVAARVRIDGRLQGRVRATQQVVIGSQGTLIGDVQGLLAVEDGGTFKGRVDVEIDTTAGDTVDPIRSVRRSTTPEAVTPVLGTAPTPRRLVAAPSQSQPVITLREEHTLRSERGASSLAEDDRPTGPIARPILSVPVRERTPTQASSSRPGGSADERRAARRPKRLVTRRDTSQESEPTNEMQRVSMRDSAVHPPHPPRAEQSSRTDYPPVVRAGGHRPGTGKVRRPTPPRPLLPVVHPPHVHKAAPPTPKRPSKGDRVKDRSDLTDEWFLDDDEELRHG
ncbi:MAG: hypothetical protein GY898_09465 [Proteobacteria bacterium]|nr:hypothetical protein [Pseudomonadota bacterium]